VGFFQVANREHLPRIIRRNGARAFVFCGVRGCGARGRRLGVAVAGTGYAKME
jgi:hypothetical protein